MLECILEGLTMQYQKPSEVSWIRNANSHGFPLVLAVQSSNVRPTQTYKASIDWNHRWMAAFRDSSVAPNAWQSSLKTVVHFAVQHLLTTSITHALIPRQDTSPHRRFLPTPLLTLFSHLSPILSTSPPSLFLFTFTPFPPKSTSPNPLNPPDKSSSTLLLFFFSPGNLTNLCSSYPLLSSSISFAFPLNPLPAPIDGSAIGASSISSRMNVSRVVDFRGLRALAALRSVVGRAVGAMRGGR